MTGREERAAAPDLRPPEEGGERRDRVLVRLPNWVGDAVMAAPAILALGRSLPDVEWCLLGGGRSAPLFAGLDPPFRVTEPLPPRSSRAGPFLRVVRRLREESFSAALVLPPSFSSALMAAAAGIPLRAGWPTDRRGWLLNEKSLRPSRERPLREQYAELAARLLDRLRPDGAPWRLPSAPVRLPLRAAELVWADAWWGECGWDPEQTIALAPGASYGPAKRWPNEKFAQLAQVLSGEGWNLVWIGGPEEREICGKLAGETLRGRGPSTGAGGRAISVAGELTLRESLAMLAPIRAVVSNDSGALHLAQAAGVPALGIYGSTSPLWTGPAGERAGVVTRSLPCSPCFLRTCPTQIECLRDLEVSEVLRGLKDLLGRTRGLRGRPAVFLDRDGTVLDLVPYLNRPDQVRLAPGAAQGLRLLQESGFALVLTTNQSAIARGMLTERGLHRIHQRMNELLEQAGVTLTGIEHCPHHPEITGECACRKPEPGMIRRAAHRYDLDLGRSFTVGDAASDLEAGRRAGTRTVLVRTGYGAETEAAGRGTAAADAVFPGLLEAADWISEQRDRTEATDPGPREGASRKEASSRARD